MSNKTEMEAAAIKAARRPLYEALVKIGVDDVFRNCTAEQIDSVIAAVWDGVRASIQLQSAKGEIPF